MTAMLEGRSICKRFGGLEALVDVSFSLCEGEILGLMGPNGAGKTTLFDVITGFVPITSGTVIFRGQNLVGMASHAIVRRGIARSFQHPKPFPDLTVARNIAAALAFGSGSAGNPRLPGSVDALLAFTGLTERRETLATSLTAVDRKRLEIARTLACRPWLACLDEPMQGLNPAEARQAADLVDRIRTEFGVTIFIVEHNVRALVSVCDRVLVLNYGRTITAGPPREIARDPEVIRAYLGEETLSGL